MNKLIFAAACILPIAFATAGYGQGMQNGSPGEANHSADSSPGNAGNHSAAPQVKNPDPAADAGSTPTGPRRSGAYNNDHSVEGASSGSTATSTGSSKGDADDRDRRTGRPVSPNGAGVVHPKEP